MDPSNCLEVIELANRLVLPRLITLIENTVIQKMTKIVTGGSEVFQEALEMLQPSQVQKKHLKMHPLVIKKFSQIHNAHQLSQWCFAYLGQNYDNVCRRFVCNKPFSMHKLTKPECKWRGIVVIINNRKP